MALTDLAFLASATRDLDQARAYFEESLAIFEACGWANSGPSGASAHGLAQVAREQHRKDEAHRLDHHALGIDLRNGYVGHAAGCLLALADFAMERGDPALAARLFGATDRVLGPARCRGLLETGLDEPSREAFQRLAEALTGLLGEDALEREVAVGRALSDTELLDLTAPKVPPG